MTAECKAAQGVACAQAASALRTGVRPGVFGTRGFAACEGLDPLVELGEVSGFLPSTLRSTRQLSP